MVKFKSETPAVGSYYKLLQCSKSFKETGMLTSMNLGFELLDYYYTCVLLGLLGCMGPVALEFKSQLGRSFSNQMYNLIFALQLLPYALCGHLKAYVNSKAVGLVSLPSCKRWGYPDREECIVAMCRISGFVLGTAATSCAFTAAVNWAAGASCGKGFGLMMAAKGTACAATGHLLPENLPAISTKLRNGTIVELDGNRIHNLLGDAPAVNFQSPSNELIFIPEFGFIKVDAKLATKIGDAMHGSNTCSAPGVQRCIPGTRLILTCTTGRRWSLAQFCGANMTCESIQSPVDRVICSW